MNIPDVPGLVLKDALELLKIGGISVKKISPVCPPRQRTGEYHDFYRVVRVKKNDDETVELLVCKPL
ncbi:hypothetical protein DFR58_12538 [Anaerobacterium chartisolvens]|uniref:PASTA domain-containing protein n=1 Tax=Anaerobacterium chartisolvens TaxID=1297424 RepID=A0A369APU3_9FIRM|nr:hypothetical protein [Anaerobacterium chartisolvens]RCX11392.1 hypothetical protein DFR58_12538 [Anaerobacterium chartisolvens]